jgi:uncharacterized protein
VDNHNAKCVYVYNKTRETFLATSATVADTYLSRLVGLLGRTRRWARPGQGLWIVPSYGVHTIGMLFSIDLVFLDRANQVVHLEEHIRPFSISKVILKADSVLELPPHTVFRSRTHVGDQLEIGPLPTPSQARTGASQTTLNGTPKYEPTIRA